MSFQFDNGRAKTFVRGALALGIEEREPVIYAKPSWSGGPSALSADQAGAFAALLKDVKCNYGQVMPENHFIMATPKANGQSDNYGCAAGGVGDEDPNNPRAYVQALDNNLIDRLVSLAQAEIPEVQVPGVRFALESLRMKVEPIAAYQAETEADCAPVQTVVKKEKTEVIPEIGDWIVRQTQGEFMVIKADNWSSFGYIEHAE